MIPEGVWSKTYISLWKKLFWNYGQSNYYSETEVEAA